MRIRLFKQVLAVLITVSFAVPVRAQDSQGAATPTAPPVSAVNDAAKAAADQRAMVGTKPLSEGRSKDNNHDFGQTYGPFVTKCQEAKDATHMACKSARDRAATAAHAYGGKAAQNKGSVEKQVVGADAQFNNILTSLMTESYYCERVFQEKCPKDCDVSQLPAEGSDEAAIAAQRTADFKSKAVQEINEDLSTGKNSCEKDKTAFIAQMTDSMNQVGAGKKGLGGIFKYVAGAAVVGGLGYMLLKGHGNDDKKKADEAKTTQDATDAANGIITDANGNKINCPQSPGVAACKDTMISLCQGDKANSAACRQFEGAYCAGDGTGTNYCLYADTKIYCSQSGDLIASSPACKWKDARPSTCAKTPEDVSCLQSGTPAALTTACADYPNDPLCKANASGRIVVQGSGGTTATTTTTDTTATTQNLPTTTVVANTDGDGAPATSSTTMSSVLGGTSTSGSGTGKNSSLQVISNNDNMWTSSGAAVKNACATGKLLNCL